MASRHLFMALIACVFAAAPSAQAAPLLFDESVTSNAIFGSGNANGGFTVDRANGVELGLRGKVRFPVPSNTFLSQGDGTYGSFQPGAFGPLSNRASWSFEWSINSDYDNTSGFDLDDLTYELLMDTDPSSAVASFVIDPINGGDPRLGGLHYWDHSIGDNTTAQGGGAEAAFLDVPGYEALIAGNNLAQNSWQLNFFSSVLPFNPSLGGIYTFTLRAFDEPGTTLLAETSIDIVVAPEPASLAVWGLGALGMAVVARRKRKLAV